LTGGAQVSYDRSLGAGWSMRGSVQNSFEDSSEDDDLRTDVFALRDQTLEPDSRVHQLRHSVRSTANTIVNAQITWVASDWLSTQFTVRPQHSYSLRDFQARVWDGTLFADQPALSDYQSTHRWQVPVTITPEYRFGGGAYIAP